jgi:hypothetical protein
MADVRIVDRAHGDDAGIASRCGHGRRRALIAGGGEDGDPGIYEVLHGLSQRRFAGVTRRA